MASNITMEFEPLTYEELARALEASRTSEAKLVRRVHDLELDLVVLCEKARRALGPAHSALDDELRRHETLVERVRGSAVPAHIADGDTVPLRATRVG